LRIVFGTKRIVFEAMKIFFLVESNNLWNNNVFSEAESFFCASETGFSIAEEIVDAAQAISGERLRNTDKRLKPYRCCTVTVFGRGATT
jgi:hypothetical protein